MSNTFEEEINLPYYFIVENTKIIGKSRLQLLDPLVQMVEVTPEFYEEDTDRYLYVNGEFILDPTYEARKTAERQAAFEREFLSTSLGNYRLVPKGYANAQQSIDTVNAIVIYSQGLTQEIANRVIFYETPDFTKPEECTEEWLVAHQHHPEPMTLQEWGQFYIEFSQAYAAKTYQIELASQN